MRSAVAVLLLAPAVLVAQGPARWSSAVAAFDHVVQTDSVVGATLVLVRDGQVATRHDVGWQDRAGKVAVTPQTIYHWGSITKTLTAVGILQLRDRGLLSLDDPITKWIPELRQVHNVYGSMDEITLRMLLSHSSGFQNPTWPYRKYTSWEPFEPTRWEQLLAMMPYQQVLFRPGSKYSYSNPAYIYLGRVIESVTGDPWQSYVYKNIWLPLGITRSYFNLTPWHLAPDRSHNYTLVEDSAYRGREVVLDNGTDFDPGVTIPNGGWNAPVSDVVKWMRFLSGARADTAQQRIDSVVLKRSTLEEMWQTAVPIGTDGAESMGLGFFLVRQGNARLVGHTGEQAGFRSFFSFNPATRAGIVGVVNTTNDVRGQASNAAFNAATAAAGAVLLP
jgi:CubicO group peptidase (beta-lactamase class C family)